MQSHTHSVESLSAQPGQSRQQLQETDTQSMQLPVFRQHMLQPLGCVWWSLSEVGSWASIHRHIWG